MCLGQIFIDVDWVICGGIMVLEVSVTFKYKIAHLKTCEHDNKGICNRLQIISTCSSSVSTEGWGCCGLGPMRWLAGISSMEILGLSLILLLTTSRIMASVFSSLLPAMGFHEFGRAFLSCIQFILQFDDLRLHGTGLFSGWPAPAHLLTVPGNARPTHWSDHRSQDISTLGLLRHLGKISNNKNHSKCSLYILGQSNQSINHHILLDTVMFLVQCWQCIRQLQVVYGWTHLCQWYHWQTNYHIKYNLRTWYSWNFSRLTMYPGSSYVDSPIARWYQPIQTVQLAIILRAWNLCVLPGGHGDFLDVYYKNMIFQ